MHKKVVVLLFILSCYGQANAMTNEQFYNNCSDVDATTTVIKAKNNYKACWHYVGAITDIMTGGQSGRCLPDDQRLEMIYAVIDVYKIAQKLGQWSKVKSLPAFERFTFITFSNVSDNGCHPVTVIQPPKMN